MDLAATNFWAHLVPEFLTSVAGTAAFYLVFHWIPVTIVVGIHVWNFTNNIRTEIQSLAASVGRIANKQIGRAQGKAAEAAHEAEAAITRNPLTAIAIAVGLGFLLGVLTRR